MVNSPVIKNNAPQPELKKTLGPFLLWGLGVGYVISGMYFGWNLGLPAGGTLGLAIATFFIIILYITFTFSYAELACAIPKAGGVFDYATKAMGKDWGFIAGMAQIIEFVFAPPAIAAAIGAYFHIFFPQFSVISIAIMAYVLFTALNIYGVKAAAIFELIISAFAVFELLLFSGITLPHFHLSNLTQNALPHGWVGVGAAVPFAIWFFLGLEGVANVAEETINPQKNILRGFGYALFTGKTGDIITIACFGAIALYIFGMIAVLILRNTSPDMPRPFRVPMYPYFPIIALLIAGVSMLAMVALNIKLAFIFFAIIALTYTWFHFIVKKKIHD